MTTPSITMQTATHGIFRVDAEHLSQVIARYGTMTTAALHDAAQELVGVSVDDTDYRDLTHAEALILISYLTGGCIE